MPPIPPINTTIHHLPHQQKCHSPKQMTMWTIFESLNHCPITDRRDYQAASIERHHWMAFSHKSLVCRLQIPRFIPTSMRCVGNRNRQDDFHRSKRAFQSIKNPSGSEENPSENKENGKSWTWKTSGKTESDTFNVIEYASTLLTMKSRKWGRERGSEAKNDFVFSLAPVRMLSPVGWIINENECMHVMSVLNVHRLDVNVGGFHAVIVSQPLRKPVNAISCAFFGQQKPYRMVL